MPEESAYFTINNLDGHDATHLAKELDTLEGILSVSVSQNSMVAVDYDPTGSSYEDILRKLDDLGYDAAEEGVQRDYGGDSNAGKWSNK